MDIYKNGYTYHIKRYGDIETDKQLIERAWFIVNYLHGNPSIGGLEQTNEEITETQFENAVQKSKIWHNTKVLKCKYNIDGVEKADDSKFYYV